MTIRSEIVVTGVGAASPIGIGKDQFWDSLAAGRGGIRRLDFPAECTNTTPNGGVVADFDPKLYVRPRKSLKVMSRDIQLAFAAADLACQDAAVPQKPVAPERFGVVFGAGIIPAELEELIGVYRACIDDGRFDFSRWGGSIAAELFPLWMLKYLPNMPACHIGIAQDARGPNNTITLGDVSSLLALCEAARIVERGQADAIIAGGVGQRLHPAAWVRSHVEQLSRCDDPAAAMRPFDARRDGLVNGEGAGAMLLETRLHAAARGAAPVARVLGFASAFQPPENKTPGGHCPGGAIRRAIIAALGDANLKPAELGVVFAHGLSTVDNDRVEAQAIRDTLGDVPVTALKSYFGHLGHGAGALEAVAAVLAVRHGQVPPTLNHEAPDPQCPVNVVASPLPLRCPTAMVLAHDAHGQAAALLFGSAG